MNKSKSDILNELIQKQRKDVYYAKKLTYRDLNRIVKYVDKSLFGEECCIWKGYISCLGKDLNNFYINFFFKDKKVGLHRLLYSNYVGNIENNEYVRFSCENIGKCCNINHFIKYSTNENDNENDNKDDNKDDEQIQENNLDEHQENKNEPDKKNKKTKQDNFTIYDFTVTF
jgi:hypothetical protein